ncbi:CDP-glycerol glycerophosphotransferase family protein [Zhongshania borealis]|uniref:Uncharacterized protein n=1 Tax=Zhongshania borealis TaxID=889488 RepID=A0ABP7X5A3_9GAMM
MHKKLLDFTPRAIIFRLWCHVLFFITRFGRSRDGIWLIGENRGDPLGDNGVWFYSYCRKIVGAENVYFVMKKGSAGANKLEFDDNVVFYGSIAHAKAFHSSSVFFYTHTFRDLAPIELFSFYGGGRYKVFLHHGVLGFKRFNEKYIKNRNEMDLFTVGSEFERRLAIEEVGVDSTRVRVTGYARYDNLFDGASSYNPKKIISYMPTHRNYLEWGGRKSEFFISVEEFLDSKELTRFLKKWDCELYFIPHKEMSPYFSHFSASSKRVVCFSYGDISVSDVLKHSDVLITDYSSVSWDFRYLNKPVLFYQSDAELYDEDRGAYIDFRCNDLGAVFDNYKDLVLELDRVACNDFCAFQGAAAGLSFGFSGGASGSCCERIYQIVLAEIEHF